MYISLDNSPVKAAGETPRGVRTVSSTVITLGIVSMLTDISSESVAAILPLYITGFLGLSTIAFGVLDGMYQGVSAITRIGAGYASDRLDQPKWVAFVGYGLAAVARAGLLFWSGFAALSTVITADRIGKGIRTAPRDALITVTSDPAHLGHSFGVHRMLDNIGAALGPLIAFVILLVVPDGFHVVFVASLAFAVIGVAVLGLLVPNVRRRRQDAAARPGKVPWRSVARGPMRRVLAAAGILGLVTIGDGFIYLVLQSRSDFAALWFPLLYVGTNVAFLAFAIPLGRLADRVGRGRVFVWGHIGLLAAYVVAVLPLADIASTIMCLVFLGVFYAATDGVLSALVSQLSGPDSRATAIGTAQTVVAVARFASAAGFGILWFAVGREPAMLAVAIVLAIAIPLVAVLLRPILAASHPEEAVAP
ncbi:MFS transporter [Microbacterium memoriense]